MPTELSVVTDDLANAFQELGRLLRTEGLPPPINVEIDSDDINVRVRPEHFDAWRAAFTASPAHRHPSGLRAAYVVLPLTETELKVWTWSP